jgi:hypothetical protein
VSSLATPASKDNPILAERVANPITLTTTTYRPLQDHSALGLSAFYIVLLGLIAGFVGATLINASVDSALGYASSQHFGRLGITLPRTQLSVRPAQGAPDQSSAVRREGPNVLRGRQLRDHAWLYAPAAPGRHADHR